MDMPWTIHECWARIEAWLEANAPWIRRSLRPPATEDEIRAAQGALGLALPADVIESYRIHDGQHPFRHFIDQKGLGFFFEDNLQTLDWIVRAGERQQKYKMVDSLTHLLAVEGPIKRELNNPRWVPLTIGAANRTVYLDLDPAPGGDVGQVIVYIHDEVKAVRVARSFHERLLHLAVAMSLDLFVYHERLGYLVDVKYRADELEYAIKTDEDAAEYRRLREIERRAAALKEGPAK
jgi:cell wall assembly regulator SMI1